MCQKTQRLWECGHSDTEDPRRCRLARNRNRASCQEYAFVWAFRDPIIEKCDGECRTCQHEQLERARKNANQSFVEQSQAYPRLKDVSVLDDETRQKSGRARFERSNSASAIVIPNGWTPAQNRLPSNANEFEQFVRGRFNPLETLPDSHVPPQLPGELLYGGPRPLPGPNATHPPGGDTSRFEPQPHAFTRRVRTVSQCYRPRAPPGYATHFSRDAQIARYHIARHQRAQITPPDNEPNPAILDDTDDPFAGFRELGAGGPQHDSKRRPSYTSWNESKGWIPPIAGPLPPRQETDTAPPSRSSSIAPSQTRSL